MPTNKPKLITNPPVPVTILEQQIMDQLMAELQTANLNFREKLQGEYPCLTAYDLRLCTYLKANFSTKEIATLRNIAPDSVKKAKHRLRKKMGINPLTSWGTAFAQ